MRTYFAIGHQEADSAYGFWFPDVEGCFGGGDSYDEAMKNAVEALRLHMELLTEMGQKLPEPRSIDDIHTDPDVQESLRDPGAFIVGVPYIQAMGAKRRVSFNADASVVAAVERQVKALGMTKTDWWLQAAHQMLGSRVLDEATPPGKRPRKRGGRRRGAKAAGTEDRHATA